ncbi:MULTISPECIES: DUF1254 domain-containing protein [unclassified Isoptericola]|uniref:DUF1254 domain-containing protein n=1 Tax=unclassified Isoptericola TaxID=2623355 RepID=UPI0036471FB5
MADGQTLAQASGRTYPHPQWVETTSRLAYVWAYPMVNMAARRDRLSAAPEPGRLGGVLPASPTGQVAMLNDYIDPGQTFIACPNQDVVYGLGYFSLDEQPVVVQVPDFGGRFFVYAFYDARTDQFGQVGSMYGSAPGHYLLVGPSWDGSVPDGIVEVIRCPTTLANAIPRIFMDDTAEDRAALQPLVDQVTVYPLSEFTGGWRTKDWSDVPTFPAGAGNGGEETKWVRPETFFDELPKVLSTIPPLPGEEALYGQFTALLEARGRYEDVRAASDAAVRDADDTLIKGFMRWEYNGTPEAHGWNRSQHNSQWGLDYYNRAATARSNMFENRPPETQYFYTDTDSDGGDLHGAQPYVVTFAAGQLPPVDGFWSLTLYNAAHFFFPNDLRRYSLGTKNKSLVHGDDGSLTLYVGAASPGGDHEANWLPAPDGPFSLYLRAYGGQEPVRDGSWTPPAIRRA